MRHVHSGTSRHSHPVLFAALVLAITVSALAGAVPAFADSAPVVTIAAPGAVSYTSAHVSGTVNPEGGPSSTIWNLEYKPTSAEEPSWVPFASGEFSGPSAEATTPEAVQGDLVGLAPGTEYVVRLVAENEFGAHRSRTAEPFLAFTTLAVPLPGISLNPAGPVTGSTAHLSAKINPGAPAGNPSEFDVGWKLECTPKCLGEEGSSILAQGGIPADNTGHTIEADTTELLYNTSYEIKLTASNIGGDANVSQIFKTQAVAPVVESSPVGTLSATTAIIGGAVDANGSPTTYWIEYADNQAFNGATSLPATHDASAGSKQTPVPVSRFLTGLQPDSTYYFRINIQNSLASSVSATQSFHTDTVEPAAPVCANEALRTGRSAALPDCRVYELVTPDLNHASGGGQPGGQEAADGKSFVYQSIDAPENAHSATTFNLVRATRDPAKGWSGVSLSPPMASPYTIFLATLTVGLSADLSSTAEVSDQPLTGGGEPSGQNVYVSRPDGTFRRITNVGSPRLPFLEIYQRRDILWGNANFTNVYYRSAVAQVPEDPTPDASVYAWSEARGVRLIGVLPDGKLASSGTTIATGMLQPASEDGKYVAFMTSEGKFYVRVDDAKTVELGAINIDITHPVTSDQGGVTPDGSKVMFTSRAELTSDANTGETGGVPNETGRDLYSYDTAKGQLTDLTVDTNPADAARGADVHQVMATTKNASYIYFTATGALASGGVPGQPSLYVWHEGHIQFIARGDDGVYVTPDGRHGAFGSTEPVTGYDNTDPVTGEPHGEVFKFSLDAPGLGIECVSCRPDGTPPTADSGLPGRDGVAPAGIRAVSDDGSRVFFQTRDAVLPQASSGHNQIFEYENGRVSALTPPDAEFDSTFLDASPSGDDVFINTYDALVPDPSNGDYAIVDAHVGGGFPVAPTKARCSGDACQPPVAPVPVGPEAASVNFLGDGNLRDTSVSSRASSRVLVSKSRTIKGTSGSLAVKVPAKGLLTVSAAGLKSTSLSVTKAGTVTVRLRPTVKAAKRLRRQGSFRTKVRVVFSDVGGRASSVSLSVTFKAASGRKGR